MFAHLTFCLNFFAFSSFSCRFLSFFAFYFFFTLLSNLLKNYVICFFSCWITFAGFPLFFFSFCFVFLLQLRDEILRGIADVSVLHRCRIRVSITILGRREQKLRSVFLCEYWNKEKSVVTQKFPYYESEARLLSDKPRRNAFQTVLFSRKGTVETATQQIVVFSMFFSLFIYRFWNGCVCMRTCITDAM